MAIEPKGVLMEDARNVIGVTGRLADTDPGTEAIYEQLKEGESHTEELEFSRWWCDQFLSLSGDQNRSLHGVNGEYKIVQGVAVLAKASAAFSRVLPGYAVVQIGELIFKRPIFVGEKVKIIILRRDEKTAMTVLEAKIFRDGELILETEVKLAHSKVLKRSIR